MMPETIIGRYVDYQCQLNKLRRETAELEEKTHSIHQAGDLTPKQRIAILSRLETLHDALLRTMTDYREIISQEESKWLEDRLETMARMMAVIEGRETL